MRALRTYQSAVNGLVQVAGRVAVPPYYQELPFMRGTLNRPADEYTPPRIEVLGSLGEMTNGGSMSGSLDANYPIGTSSQFNGGLFS